MSDTPWNDDPERAELAEGELLDAVGEGESGAADAAADDEAVGGSDTADERL